MRRKIFLLCFLLIPAVLAFSDLTRDLIMAVSRGKLKDVQKLIEKGAKVNDQYIKDRTPLHWAVLQPNIKITAYLIGKGAVVDARDKNMATPLHYCALKKNLDMVKLLVMKGADINAPDKYGWTPLHYFTYYEDVLAVKYLIVQGAVLTNQSTQKNIDIDEKSTPLDIAIKKNYSNIITALENPDKYMRLSKRPVLFVSCAKNLGPDNILIAPRKGFLNFTVENKGGFEAYNVTLEMEKISNCGGLTLENPPVFDLWSGWKRDFSIGVEAAPDIKEGTALFRVYAHETNSFIKSEDMMLEIPIMPPQPPAFEISASMDESPDKAFHARQKSHLRVAVLNKGRGYSENTLLQITPVKGCEEIAFSSVSNIPFSPGEKKYFDLTAETSSDLKDGTAEFLVTAQDPYFQIMQSNLIKVETKRLLKPLLAVEFLTDMKIEQYSVTNSLSSNQGEGVTNIVMFKTNIEPLIKIFNRGEASARDLSFDLRVYAIETNNHRETNLNQAFHYSVQEIRTNDFMILQVPLFLTNYLDYMNNVWNLSGNDGEKLSFINANLSIENMK